MGTLGVLKGYYRLIANSHLVSDSYSTITWYLGYQLPYSTIVVEIPLALRVSIKYNISTWGRYGTIGQVLVTTIRPLVISCLEALQYYGVTTSYSRQEANYSIYMYLLHLVLTLVITELSWGHHLASKVAGRPTRK